MSTGDILLISSILSRGLYAHKAESSSGLEDIQNSMKKKSVKKNADDDSIQPKEFKSVVAYDITVSVGSVAFILFDDITGFVKPVFSCGIGTFELATTGTTESLAGKGDLSLSVDHYNFMNGLYEPLIERTVIVAGFKRSFGMYDVAVTSSELIQIDLSCLMLKSILQTLTDIQLHDTERRCGTQTPSPHVTWIENHLGVDVEIVSSGVGCLPVTIRAQEWAGAMGTNSTLAAAFDAMGVGGTR